MSNTTGPQIPAGWYRDPAGSDHLRWWDGAAWTEHLSPPPAAQPAQQHAVQQQPVPTPVIAPTPIEPTPLAQAPVAQAPVAMQPTSPSALAPVYTPTATLEERPYVPFPNSAPYGAGQYGAGMPQQGEFARPLQWNTAGVWFLATSLIWSGLIGVIVGLVAYTSGAFTAGSFTAGSPSQTVLELTASGIALVLSLLAASRDRARLRQLGYLELTSIWWVLVLIATPLVYLIIRTVRVRRQSGHGQAPLIFFLVNGFLILLLAIGAAVAIPVYLAQHGGTFSGATNASNAASLASGIKQGLQNDGGDYTVTCSAFAAPTTAPIDVSCTAVDASTNQPHVIAIEVDPAKSGGKPSFSLLSVTPPIAH
jgi:hypothetical protein